MIGEDGTPFKTRLGANAILGISLAAARAGAADTGMPLYRYLREKMPAGLTERGREQMPTPMMNLINGGKHACNKLDIQEFMVVPRMDKSFAENLRAGVEVFHVLKKILEREGLSTNVGDEGGVAPELDSHDRAMEFLLRSIESAGYRPGEDIFLALDCAASEFYKDGSYSIEGRTLSPGETVEYYKDLCRRYPVCSIEDGLDEGDHDGWKMLTEKMGKDTMLVGDDLFVTNKDILTRGIENAEANAILIKVNQIGTLTETFETLELAVKSNYKAVISHRSGETGDTFIADLAVASGCGYIKTGSASRSDRTEKYNRLLRIEEELS